MSSDHTWPVQEEVIPHTSRRSAHLLVIWRERAATPAGPAVWRFSLEDMRDGARRGFGSLEELVAFLRAKLKQEEERW